MLDRLFLIHQSRAEGDAERGAIGLQRGVAARAEQRRRVDAGGGEAGAVLRVDQEVADDLRGIGVDAVDARASESANDLEIVIADVGFVAELITRRAGIAVP